MEIIYNNDGSIKYLNIAEWVQKNAHNVNKVFVYVDGYSVSDYALKAGFVLPNGSTNEITTSGTETRVIEGVPYTGRYFYLTNAQTPYAGNLKMSIAVMGQDSSVLWTYQATIVINDSSSTSTETTITNAQYNALLLTLASYQPKIEGVFAKAITINAYSSAPTQDSDFVNSTYLKQDGIRLNNLAEFTAYVSGYTLGNNSFITNSAVTLTNKYLIANNNDSYTIIKDFSYYKNGDLISVLGSTTAVDQILSLAIVGTSLFASTSPIKGLYTTSISNGLSIPVSSGAVYTASYKKLYKHTIMISGIVGLQQVEFVSFSQAAVSSYTTFQTYVENGLVLSSSATYFSTKLTCVLTNNGASGIYAWIFASNPSLSPFAIPSTATLSDTVVQL